MLRNTEFCSINTHNWVDISNALTTHWSRSIKFSIQIGLDWPQMGQIWDFLRSVSVYFGAPRQNILKLILKSPRLVPFGGQSDPMCMPNLTSLFFRVDPGAVYESSESWEFVPLLAGLLYLSVMASLNSRRFRWKKISGLVKVRRGFEWFVCCSLIALECVSRVLDVF